MPVARMRSAAMSTRRSAKSVWRIASSSAASDPGRRKWCSSQSAAVSVRRGSRSTMRPPRSRTPRSLARTSPRLMTLPMEAAGFAPSMSTCRTRSMSGTVIERPSPYICIAAKILGFESCELASKRLCVPSAASSACTPSAPPWLFAMGLPLYIATASVPCARDTAARRVAASSRASSHGTASQPPAVRRLGLRSRSGSS